MVKALAPYRKEPLLTSLRQHQDATNNLPSLSDEPESKRAKELMIAIPLILALSLSRFILDRTVFRYLANWFKLRKTKPVEKQDVLEMVYKKKEKGPCKQHIQSLANQLSWTTSQVKTWFKRRAAQDRPSIETKFRESLWRLLFHAGIEVYAFYYISMVSRSPHLSA
ncbi:ceramide synthase 4-like [Discoglossus pictus]